MGVDPLSRRVTIRSFDWIVVSLGAAFAGAGMFLVPLAARQAFAAPSSLGPTAASTHDAAVWLPAFLLPLVLVTGATGALVRRGSPTISGIAAGIVGYWCFPAVLFIVRHASEHDCGTEDGCTSVAYLLVEALILAGMGTLLVGAFAALGGTLGGMITSRRSRNARPLTGSPN